MFYDRFAHSLPGLGVFHRLGKRSLGQSHSSAGYQRPRYVERCHGYFEAFTHSANQVRGGHDDIFELMFQMPTAHQYLEPLYESDEQWDGKCS